MIKKIVIFLSIVIILFLGLNLYFQKKYETVECWWGVMYPSLSFVGFEDEKETKVSSLNENYLYIAQTNEPIRYKFAIVEWFNKIFSF